MQCTKCGTTLVKDNRLGLYICPQCGKKFKTKSKPATVPPDEPVKKRSISSMEDNDQDATNPIRPDVRQAMQTAAPMVREPEEDDEEDEYDENEGDEEEEGSAEMEYEDDADDEEEAPAPVLRKGKVPKRPTPPPRRQAPKRSGGSLPLPLIILAVLLMASVIANVFLAAFKAVIGLMTNLRNGCTGRHFKFIRRGNGFT